MQCPMSVSVPTEVHIPTAFTRGKHSTALTSADSYSANMLHILYVVTHNALCYHALRYLAQVKVKSPCKLIL